MNSLYERELPGGIWATAGGLSLLTGLTYSLMGFTAYRKREEREPKKLTSPTAP